MDGSIKIIERRKALNEHHICVKKKYITIYHMSQIVCTNYPFSRERIADNSCNIICEFKINDNLRKSRCIQFIYIFVYFDFDFII